MLVCLAFLAVAKAATLHDLSDKMAVPPGERTPISLQQMSQVNDEEKAKANLEAAVIAEQLWDQANDVSSAHPYLVSKKVDAFGIKHNGQKLLIPLRDHKGKLWSFQEIDHKGNKLFLKNGKVKGLFHIIGEQTDIIFIGEGYATMASIHVATEKACVVAFNAGNLRDVCSQVRYSYPDNELWSVQMMIT